MSDVYAGHDLTDDWRVVIPFQSGQATRGGGGGGGRRGTANTRLQTDVLIHVVQVDQGWC